MDLKSKIMLFYLTIMLVLGTVGYYFSMRGAFTGVAVGFALSLAMWVFVGKKMVEENK